MDEATSNRILEAYLAGQAGEVELEQALAFLKDRAQFDKGLAALYRNLALPGGISHEMAQDTMPYYLEPLARAQLPLEERRRFVAHLAQCPSCASEFLELQGLTAAPVKLKQPALSGLKPWPYLEPVIQTFKGLVKTSRYVVTFNPVVAGVREGGAVYKTGPESSEAVGEYTVLFEDFLDESAETGLQASVTAWRTSDTSCDLQIELVDPLEQDHQAGQKVTLEYGGMKITRQTGENGEIVFPDLEISRLPSLKIQIEVKS